MKTITLFSPHDVPGLYDAFGTRRFDSLYTEYENDETIPKTSIGFSGINSFPTEGESRDWSSLHHES